MVNSPKCYRIYWCSIITNNTGNGQRILGYDNARQQVFLLNKKYSGIIEHWLN